MISPSSTSFLSILLTSYPLLSSAAAQDVQVLDHTHLLRHTLDIGGHRNLQEAAQTEGTCPGTPYLWKIIKDETGEHVGFGLGTLHRPIDLVLTDNSYASIKSAVDDSCAVYGEIDLADMTVAAALAECVGEFTSEAARISDIQDESLRLEYESFTREFAALVAGEGADAAVVDSINQEFMNLPLFTLGMFITLYNTPEYEEYLVPTFLGKPLAILDEEVLSLGRPNGGVEMVSTQCDILRELYVTPENLNEVSLRMSLNATNNEEINLYRCGDIDSFAEYQEMAFEEAAAAAAAAGNDEMGMMFSEFQSALLDERNKQMAEMIDNILNSSDNRALFAFGVSHWIVGENKLLNLLKDYGYSLEYVPNYEGNEGLSDEECGVVFNNVTGEFDLIVGMSNSTGPTPTASPVSSSAFVGTGPSSGAGIKSTASIFYVLCVFGSLYLLN